MNHFHRAVALPLTVLAAPAATQGFFCDYEPNQRDVVLNTDFTLIAPRNCAPVSVSGGVFTFRNVRIPFGVSVRGEGSNPMIWIVAGDFVVDGVLDVSGRAGTDVNTLNSANFPAPGGVGVCSSGAGGIGSPNTSGTSPTGGAGRGPNNRAGLGGQGGRASCMAAAGCGRGSGGGGGSFASVGDPFYKLQASGSSVVQQLGFGGYGCTTRSLVGGVPGLPTFTDGRADNDFFGLGVDFNRRILIGGELGWPVGGAGGGGGGDEALACSGNPNWMLDARGGGGGSGGGALVIFALGRVVVGPQGAIRADGGDGGGGEQAGSNNRGGGGGGGSGGMVLVYSRQYIELHVHGETYANDDFEFVISADGGIGRQGQFSGRPILAKYPPPPRSAFDQAGAGGLGGLGLVQLMAPLDGLNADGTNTVLDDHIRLVRNGMLLRGADKQRYLAWRGYPNAQGIDVDDFGRPTAIGANEGDIRPAPKLLPAL